MLGKNTLLALMLMVPFFSNTAQAVVTCPIGWFPDTSNTKCQPNKPSSDYFYVGTDTNPTVRRAICGGPAKGGYTRIPVTPSFEPLQISTSTYPNSSYDYSAPTGTVSVPTTKSYNTSDPSAYLYENLTRCACFPSATAPTPAPGLSQIQDTLRFTGGNNPGSFARVYPDTYEVISTQNPEASAKYNLVAFGSNPNVDGREGDVYNTSGVQCGCPNINEQGVVNGTTTSGGPVGEHCEPLISSTSVQGRVLTTYNPLYHDAAAPGITATGPQYTGAPPVSSIVLPTATGGSQLYKRKIWTCAPPYKLDTNSWVCAPPANWSNHACNDGGGVQDLASPVNGALVTGADAVAKFNNTINKKLACCMNDYGNSGAFIKFDCIENAKRTYSDFNALWTETDVAIDSSSSNIATNAITLAGPLGKYLTGFYTLDGVRCEEFSEFAGPYSATKVSKNANGTFTSTAIIGQQSILPPAAMMAIFSKKSVPTTAAQMRRCPILARAAIIVTCPPNPELPVVQKTFTASGVTHCSAASSVQVHIRIEQIFEVEGLPRMKPIDTIAEQRLASSISVDKIIANKSGSGCPGGTTKQGDACVYQ